MVTSYYPHWTIAPVPRTLRHAVGCDHHLRAKERELLTQPQCYHGKRGRLNAGPLPLACTPRADVLNRAVAVQALDG